jgi:hypothetical protein
LNTQTSGQAIVVYNPLNIEREDVVEADLQFEAKQCVCWSDGAKCRRKS